MARQAPANCSPVMLELYEHCVKREVNLQKVLLQDDKGERHDAILKGKLMSLNDILAVIDKLHDPQPRR